MTAVVGILNKQAVALATDSAVTIEGENGHKIFNKANKLFALSKFHPVGIMIYNSAEFLSTPWETIIKVYRKHLGENSFPTLKEYEIDFIKFLHSQDFFNDIDSQLQSLKGFSYFIINEIVLNICTNFPGLMQDLAVPKNQEMFLQHFEDHLNELIKRKSTQTDFCVEFEDFTFEMFNTFSDKLFDDFNQEYFAVNNVKLSEALLLKVKMIVYLCLIIKEFIPQYQGYTGLVFTGFGEREIYPQLSAVNISLVCDNRLRFINDDNNVASITNLNKAAICPFAQRDVINTILTGIDPHLDNIYFNNFKAIFEKYNQQILTLLEGSSPIIFEQVKNLNTDLIVDELNNLNQQIKTLEFIVPLINAVSSLSKEDLAEMAESLIYLTYLKRRITFAEESVGGPVDVAIISKGDGFVWIKRKHYFKPEYNQHFFDNYSKI